MNEFPKCKSCAYFVTFPDGRYGECRRHSPEGQGDKAQWPILYYHNWCGDHSELGQVKSGYDKLAKYLRSPENG